MIPSLKRKQVLNLNPKKDMFIDSNHRLFAMFLLVREGKFMEKTNALFLVNALFLHPGSLT